MTKLPKSVRIAGQKWTLHLESHSEDDLRLFGETDDHELTITLFTRPHKDYPKRGTIQATLFHECLHAALHSTGMTAMIGDDDKEEALVTALENAMWPLVQSGLFR